MKKIIIMATTIAFTTSIYANSTPKWCKSNRLSKTEKIICSDIFLQEADILLSKIYDRLLAKLNMI